MLRKKKNQKNDAYVVKNATIELLENWKSFLSHLHQMMIKNLQKIKKSGSIIN